MAKLLRLYPASLALGLSAVAFAISLIILPSCFSASIPAARTLRSNTGITELGGKFMWGEVRKDTYVPGEAGSMGSVSTETMQSLGGGGWAYQGFALGSNIEIGAGVCAFGMEKGYVAFQGAGLLLKLDPMPDDWPVHLIPYTTFANIGTALVFTPAKWIELFASAMYGYSTEGSLGLRVSMTPWLRLGLMGSIYAPNYSGTTYPYYMHPYYDVSLAASLVWPTGASKKYLPRLDDQPLSGLHEDGTGEGDHQGELRLPREALCRPRGTDLSARSGRGGLPFPERLREAGNGLHRLRG
jgi:hypothetical protein